MGHNMFVSWVLKIPPAARFPVWEVSLHFQKEVRGFSSVRLSIPNTQNDWTKLGTGKTNTFCAKPMIPRCKLEAQKIISLLKLPKLLSWFLSLPVWDVFIFYCPERNRDRKLLHRNIQSRDVSPIQKIYKYQTESGVQGSVLEGMLKVEKRQ